ncbi:SAM-dependent methyltransferase [Streptomyces anulatus]|uniref:SAM-dependent methyltransferase n=1 Tax=Streptomyces anulatus TaxID=1892 RepID=UPI00344AE7A9
MVLGRCSRGAPPSRQLHGDLSAHQPRPRTAFRDNGLHARDHGGRWGEVRAPDEVDRFFDGLEFVGTSAPVEVSRWLPDSDLVPRQKIAEWIEYGAVARVT